MLSIWQHSWREKLTKSTKWYFYCPLIVCCTQIVDLDGFKYSTFSSISQIGSGVMAQTLSEDQLFKKLIERAGTAYKKKSFKEAAQYFERAMVLNPNPNIYWNLSVCYYKLADYPKALANANAYLQKGSPNSKMRTKVEAKKKDILYHLQEAYLSPKAKTFSANKQENGTTQNPTLLNPRDNQRRIRPDSSEMFEMSSPKSLNSVNNMSDRYPQSTNIAYNRPSGKRDLIVWGSVASVLLVSSLGLHMYGDQIWDNRPLGGGTPAQDARRQALLVSWVGDGALALGLTSLVVGLVSYLNHMEESQSTSTAFNSYKSAGSGYVSFELLQSQNTRQPRVNGGLLGWQLNF